MMKKDFELAIIFKDNLVFQREKPILIFGKAFKQEKIRIEFLNYRYEFLTGSGDFCFTLTKLPVIKQGFNIRIFTNNQEVELKNCLVGDVFFCGGQSNMAFTVNEAINITEVESLNIRLFEVPKLPYEGAEIEFPWLYSNKPNWLIAKAENIKWFSAIGYLLAKGLVLEYDIPIGIISCNMGDTTIFTWIDETTLNNHQDLKFYLDDYQKEYQKYRDYSEYDQYFKKQLPLLMEFYGLIEKGVSEGLDSQTAHENAYKTIPNPYLPMGPKHQNRPFGLMETMTSKIIPYPHKAMVYYQGESDKLNYSVYKEALDALIESYRKLFNDNLPVIIVQIAGYEYIDIDPLASSYLRTAQADYVDLLALKYLVSAVDLGEKYNIHPKDKTLIAKRLVGVIREFIYQDEKNSLSPQVDNFEIKENKVIITTKHNSLSLIKIKTDNDYFLAITKDNQKKRIFDYLIIGNKIVIKIEEGYQEIRYGYCNFPELFIYTENNLPLLPFRICLS